MFTKTMLLNLPLLAFLALFGSGCAFGTRVVTLAPVTPELMLERVPTGARSPNVFVRTPVDRRAERGAVGCVRNSFAMRTADVETKQNIPKWVQQQFSDALAQSGCRVLPPMPAGTDPPGADAVVVLTLHKFFCDSFFFYKATVEVEVEARAGAQVLFYDIYSGQGKNLNWAATASGFGKTLREAMRDCLEQAIPDLRLALDKAPAVSAAGAVADSVDSPSGGEEKVQ
jgi:hypothetical protein